jgi:hypothetical protein
MGALPAWIPVLCGQGMREQRKLPVAQRVCQTPGADAIRALAARGEKFEPVAVRGPVLEPAKAGPEDSFHELTRKLARYQIKIDRPDSAELLRELTAPPRFYHTALQLNPAPADVPTSTRAKKAPEARSHASPEAQTAYAFKFLVRYFKGKRKRKTDVSETQAWTDSRDHMTRDEFRKYKNPARIQAGLASYKRGCGPGMLPPQPATSAKS